MVYLHNSQSHYVDNIKETTKTYYNNALDYIGTPDANSTVGNLLNWASSNNNNDNNNNGNSPAWIPEGNDLETMNELISKLNDPLFQDFESFTDDDYKNIFTDRQILYDDVVKNSQVSEPKVDNLVYKDDDLAGQAKATILSLVRNEDQKEIISAIRQMEDHFNKNFNYPYTFLNDDEFTEEFKEAIKEVVPTDRILQFGRIESEIWDRPSSIDDEKYQQCIEKLDQEEVQYVKKESYHNMCRFYSKNFYKHPLLQDYKYTWRLEPGINFYCDINYDVFQFMELNNKIYGFVLNLYDSPESIRSLWTTTMEFINSNPEYLNSNGAFEWLKDNGQKPNNFNITGGYSTCHFWTNFEITNLEFLRSEPYEKFMDFLDEKGGFYYERWGDAPVRSIALALFADKRRIHWFRDIGYNHAPYTNCPKCPPDSNRCNGNCKPGHFTPWKELNIENCQPVWIKYIMNEEERNLY
ncbi:hypothetical protein TBLA_0B04620 [Henningerozyma blattae CBS 6284]|uniref:Glycosyltransferase family 15 protein n=1 Tax=Henningerozyma blattae (strain ATCC 34711 / CBS 6284 / DSM 70876 / NBRC 10599 / NRRL Y-10934 / UCD 77-7) TaxID=1071380 RepID=I2GYU6_HENB6|nr:hypothetical protein TBLA_0B04620 [Tetrapisispora blattae CBS 6284]CCH59298.1 hypothetical protein TBLA_0B04620 [Tetrapisispora blattae CBS 6284]